MVPPALMLASVVGAVGCGDDGKSEADAEAAPEVTNAPAGDPAAVGAEKFANCVGCHGEKGEGKVGMGPRLASPSFLAAASDDFLRKTILEGRAGTTMAPWRSSLTDPEADALIQHIRGFAEHEPAKLDESPLKGHAELGEEVFKTICAGCHGRTGGGYMESSSGTGIGRKAFLDAASDGYLRYIIRNGKDLTKMKPFKEDAPTAVADLSDQQIEDVIAYLRANAW
jgi:cytochrome c oxidase cbb3-type subunit 3